MNFINFIACFFMILAMNLCAADECDGNSAQNHVKQLFKDLRGITTEISVDDSCADEKLDNPTQIEYYVQMCGIAKADEFIFALYDKGLYKNDSEIKKKTDEFIAYYRKYLEKCNWLEPCESG